MLPWQQARRRQFITVFSSVDGYIQVDFCVLLLLSLSALLLHHQWAQLPEERVVRKVHNIKTSSVAVLLITCSTNYSCSSQADLVTLLSPSEQSYFSINRLTYLKTCCKMHSAINRIKLMPRVDILMSYAGSDGRSCFRLKATIIKLPLCTTVYIPVWYPYPQIIKNVRAVLVKLCGI